MRMKIKLQKLHCFAVSFMYKSDKNIPEEYWLYCIVCWQFLHKKLVFIKARGVQLKMLVKKIQNRFTFLYVSHCSVTLETN